ncbi:uncharacterized protein LOC119675301 [Teleopsis dalmanni]|uniref:uncharacterized protein LOC119675301 n=1 Tax=Teleopsis dalmanni TaxID=139649 RepID=UPI0018CD022A|nr:uncharacterized protein LOC119675301 [Teleopsis dalmanni]
MTADAVAVNFYATWVSRFGAPKVITTDQRTQFETDLFQALADLVGTKRIRTTPYHPAANAIVEEFHHTLKAELMARPKHTLLQLLPSVILGLQVTVKEDIEASAAEMIYGINLRLPGEFFVHNTQSTSSTPPNQSNFLNKLREYLRQVRLTPAAYHSNRPIFIRKLEPQYTDPYKVLNKISERVYTIEVGDKMLSVSMERLKPAFLKNTDVSAEPTFNPSPKHDTLPVKSTK